MGQDSSAFDFLLAMQYDDVAPDEDEPNETSAKQPVRKAPPVPPATADNSDPPDVQAADDAAPGTNCIKIDPPGKLILSKRKGLREVLFS